ncbi:hypothetical protein ACFWY5_40760 [Nonomuraea sp. NPDC059007]|uniref:hypothetical protein n=1 Tax=Nonomuraea sp. NPDC059007 TaxID=3346692 RepID=UPI003678D685
MDAWLRPSNTSQPNTRIEVRYSRRTDTDRDLACAGVWRSKPQIKHYAMSFEALRHVCRRDRLGSLLHEYAQVA